MYRYAIALSLASLTSQALAQYEVREIPGTQTLTLSLKLPAHSEIPVTLAPRGTAWGLKSQVSNARCAGAPLTQDADGYWVAPAQCAMVTWSVKPDHVGKAGVNASAQRTLSVGPKPWILLSEPTSLLRAGNAPDATDMTAVPASETLYGATPGNADSFRVPSTNNAPEFYVLAHTPPTHR